MIPEAAVEAAELAISELYGLESGPAYMFARAALEGAESHMLREAWESAYGLGYADRNVGAAPTRHNPYRPAT